MKYHRASSESIVVKIGSESIDRAAILVPEIAEILQNTHYKVLLVTSGAVEFGRRALGLSREEMNHQNEKDPDYKRRLAAYGQAGLIEFYNRILIPHKMHAAQILTTHADLEDNTDHFTLARELVS